MDITKSRSRLLLYLGLGLLILALLTAWTRSVVARSFHQQLTSELRSILTLNVVSLDSWLKGHEEHARYASSLVSGEGPGAALLARGSGEPDAQLREQLDAKVRPLLRAYNYSGYILVDIGGAVVETDLWEMADVETLSPFLAAMLPEVASSRARVLPPEKPNNRAIHQYVAAVVTAPDKRPLGHLLLKLAAEDTLSSLPLSQWGASGETLLLDDRAVLLHDSRFRIDLETRGLLEIGASSAAFEIPLRVPRDGAALGPLTSLAATVLERSDGVDTRGYISYHGGEVIGAWTWLKSHNLGVGVEISTDEALAPLKTLQRANWMMLSGFTLAMATLAVLYTLLLHALRRKTVDMVDRDLGPYKLLEKIGSGGMGEVYHAHHARLRRPTAVKLIRPDRHSSSTLARFEREVIISSTLNHPNTIIIYDYGHTDEGIFYYAMEYLPGITLSQLVRSHGAQPSARVIHFMRQICGSLEEAHALGLVHRDVKPANLILCERGGVLDMVKVLDFGLAKPYQGESMDDLTVAEGMMGTPRYAAPECFLNQPASPATDIYALGIVGLELLWGRPVFEGSAYNDLKHAHLNEQPQPPPILGDIDYDLQELLLRCLAKDPSARPKSMEALDSALAACPAASRWTRTERLQWWDLHGARLRSDTTKAPLTFPSKVAR